MTNPYYNPSGVPQTGSQGASAAIRAELASVAAGFALLPTLTANKAVVVNAGGTALVPTTGSLTLDGNLVTTTSKTVTFSNTTTFTSTDGASVNFGGGGTVLYSGGAYVSSIAGTANEITASAATGAVTLSLPSALTFTGKTVTGGTFASPTISGTVAGAHSYSGALTFSAAITYGGVTFNNAVTGSGNLVGSVSPTFSGSLTFGDSGTWSSNGISSVTKAAVGGAYNAYSSQSIAAVMAAGGAGIELIDTTATSSAKRRYRIQSVTGQLAVQNVSFNGLSVVTYLTIDGTDGLYFTSGCKTTDINVTGALTYGGVTLSNSVTGTGSMVLSAGPTLTGTTIASNITISGTAKFTGAMGSPVSNGDAYLGGESTYGFRFAGKGSVFDAACFNSAGSGVWTVPTGTQTFTLSGALQLGNAYVATPQVCSGYVTIKDSGGTTYKVLVAA